MLNIYEQISRNKNRSNLIISLFIIFIVIAAYLITYTFNLDTGFIIVALIFSFLSAGISYFWGENIVLSLNHAQIASREDYFDYYTVVENLSQGSALPMPKIYIIDSPAPNAFATGRDPQHSVVAATTGLLNKLNRSQLEAVMAHEMSHIKNYDIRLMMIVSLLIGSLAILTNLAYRQQFFNRDEHRQNNAIFMFLGVIMIIFAPIVAQLIQLAISRRREYLADASGVKLTRQPQALIDALTIISADNHILESASPATASLYISNPFKNQGLAKLFSTHPLIEDRIQALQAML